MPVQPHRDHVRYASRLARLEFLLPGILVLLGLLYWLDLGTGWLGRWLTSLPGLEGSSTENLRILSALTVVLLLGSNLLALSRFTAKIQMYLVWGEMALLVLAFFYSFDLSFEFIGRKIGFLVSQGVSTTLYISAISIVLAFLLALLGAIAKLSSNGIALGLANFYTSLFRGLPLLMQIYIIYLGLPQLGFVVDAIPAGIAALALCYGAYMTEIFRAGIESIARGQWEAARALGLKPGTILSRVILPQAMRVIVPPTGNQFIAMIKDSSLVSVVGVWELMYLARTQGQTEFRHVEMLITASLIYWLLSIVLELLQKRVERYFNRSFTPVDTSRLHLQSKALETKNA